MKRQPFKLVGVNAAGTRFPQIVWGSTVDTAIRSYLRAATSLVAAWPQGDELHGLTQIEARADGCTCGTAYGKPTGPLCRYCVKGIELPSGESNCQYGDKG